MLLKIFAPQIFKYLTGFKEVPNTNYRIKFELYP